MALLYEQSNKLQPWYNMLQYLLKVVLIAIVELSGYEVLEIQEEHSVSHNIFTLKNGSVVSR